MNRDQMNEATSRSVTPLPKEKFGEFLQLQQLKTTQLLW